MIATTTTTLPNGLSGECAVIESTDEEIFVDIPLDDSVIIGEEYVFTIYVNPTKQMAVELIGGTKNGVGIVVQNGWKRIDFPVLLTAKTLTLQFEPSKVYLYEAQLENGSVISSWKESTYDYENSVDNKLTNYSTTSEVNSKIEQTMSSIRSEVSATYTTISIFNDGMSAASEDATNKANNALNSAIADTDTKLQSYSTTVQMNAAIEEKADSITSTVNKQITETKSYADTVSGEAQSNAESTAKSYADTAKSDAISDTDEKLKSYSTTTQMNSAIEQKADSITSEVSKTYATQSNVESLATRVTAAESTITQQADQISSKVSKDGVISAINQTAESVTINASKINLNGAVTANNYFRINTDGSMEATAGKFGCLTISGNYVQADSVASGTGYRMYIQKPINEDTWCFSTQYGDLNGELQGKFIATASGYVYANSIEVAEDANIHGNAFIDGAASVTGDAFIDGAASVTGDAFVTGVLTAGGDNYYTDSKFTCNGKAVVTGMLVTGGVSYYEDGKFTCNGHAYIEGKLTIGNEIYASSRIASGSHMRCKGTMEVLTSGFNESQVILHNDYDRKAYIKIDSSQYLWLVPYTSSSGYESSNGAYLNLTTGAFSVASLTNRSSRRYKENIENINDDVADRLLDIQIVHFDYKSEYGDKDMYGVIAEDVLSIHPNAVSFGYDGLPEGVDYTRFIPLIIRKLQMQEERINNLNDIVTHLIGISMSGSL